jgi:hypothetical protein
MRRLVRIGIAFAIVGALSMPTPATAGGGNYVEFDQQFNSVGSQATVKADFYADKIGTRAQGPFYLYLERLDYGGQGWDLPKVGEHGVYRVATAKITWDETPRFLPGGSVSATFEVPDVETGRYLVSICNVNCEHRLGDIDTTGYFRIVGTPAEARARAKIAALRTEFMRFRIRDDRHDDKAFRRLHAEVDAAERGEQSALTDLAFVRETTSGLRHDVTQAVDRMNDMETQRNFAVVGLLMAMGIAMLLAMRRRKTDLQLEAFLQDVRERRDRDLFELVGGPDGGFLDVADLPEVDRSGDKDHVGVR